MKTTASLLLLACMTHHCHAFVVPPSPSIATATPKQPKTPSKSAKITTILHASQDTENNNNNEEDDTVPEEQAWEWDGTIIEGAHDAEFDSIDETDAFMPSLSFLSMANSVSSPALDAAMGGGSGAGASGGAATGSGVSQVSGFDPLKNMGILHRLELEKEQLAAAGGGDVTGGMSEEDLMEMGGDPSFLDFDTDDENDWKKETRSMDEIDADFFGGGWDGTVDEDAHMDFD